MSNTMEALTTDTPDLSANDFIMARNMAELLHKHYPGHLWAVTCDGTKGIATIRNLMLSGDWGFILKLPAIYSASEWDKRVVMAGGEVLERYRIARAGAERTMDQMIAAPKDFSGRILKDLD